MGIKDGLIVFETEETEDNLKNLKEKIIDKIGDENAGYLLDYPVIYIHTWQSRADEKEGVDSIYVGESTDVIKRTSQHYIAAEEEKNWQWHLKNDGDTPSLYIIGHSHFNKSLTLDLENRLIDFCLSMDTTRIYNGRGNPQGRYSNEDELDEIFSVIWKKLKKSNDKLFLSESQIKKSAIYKASPNHKLTSDQLEAKNKIIERVFDAICNNKGRQLIFVEGDAGTGKTVLTSSTFYELLEMEAFEKRYLNCYMLVNHEEQLRVYRDIGKKLGVCEDRIIKPTSFINACSGAREKVDVVFIDEAHLMWTQGKQSYRGENQLDDIMNIAHVTVIMFDRNQVLRTEQYWEDKQIEEKINFSKGQDNYIELKNQYRMTCAQETVQWIDLLTKELKIDKLHLSKKNQDSNGYEVVFFDSVDQMQKEIVCKAGKPDSCLSRLIATYDWEYKGKKGRNGSYWQVEIGEWSLPWNGETFDDQPWGNDKRKKRREKALAWAEQAHTINEVGSIFTIQGFDLQYAGVIIGPSVCYDKKEKCIYFDEGKKKYSSMLNNRTLSDGQKKKVSDELFRHELRVLMTRGTKGLYIYACDNDLREALKEALK